MVDTLVVAKHAKNLRSEQGFDDAVAAFARGRGVRAFNKSLRDATNEVLPPPH